MCRWLSFRAKRTRMQASSDGRDGLPRVPHAGVTSSPSAAATGFRSIARTSSSRPFVTWWRLHAGRVELFQLTFDVCHEAIGHCAIDQPVIEPERKISHRSNRNRIVDHHSAFLDRPDAKDRYLRLVDDWQPELGPEVAGIR